MVGLVVNVFVCFVTGSIAWMGGPVFWGGQFLVTLGCAAFLAYQVGAAPQAFERISAWCLVAWVALNVSLFFVGDSMEVARLNREYLNQYKLSMLLPVPDHCTVDGPWRAMPYNEFVCSVSQEQVVAQFRSMKGPDWRVRKEKCTGAAFISTCQVLTDRGTERQVFVYERDGKTAFNFLPR